MGPLLTVRDYMTAVPHSLGVDETLADAARLMRKHGIGQVPVLEAGVLRGVLSEHDLAVLTRSGSDGGETIRVGQAMSMEPYSVSARAPLSRVAKAMLNHKIGCAVVMDGAHVRGIFTSADALRALLDLLEERARPEDTMEPAQVRSVILSEHVHLRGLISQTEMAASRVVEQDAYGEEDVAVVRGRARQLVKAMAAHIELENRVLVPAIRKVDGFGPVRADRMLAEHAEQARSWNNVLMQLDDQTQPALAIGKAVLLLTRALREDMAAEEEALLNQDLLRDEMICIDIEDG